MPGSYVFSIDERHDLVHMTLSGFFMTGEVMAFDRARSLAYRQLRCRPNHHLTLIDMRGTAIQTQGVVEAFTASINDPTTTSRKLAIVVAKSLARLQVKRVASGRNAMYFTTVEEAKSWLLAPDRGKQLIDFSGM